MHKVKAVVALSQDAPVTVTTINVPDPGKGEALVKVLTCGVCQTDHHYVTGGVGQDFPYLLGHESAGIVEAVGDDVTDIAPRRPGHPQLACSLRRMPRMPQGPAAVLLRNPQRNPEDDPRGRHRTHPRTGYRLLR